MEKSLSKRLPMPLFNHFPDFSFVCINGRIIDFISCISPKKSQKGVKSLFKKSQKGVKSYCKKSQKGVNLHSEKSQKGVRL